MKRILLPRHIKWLLATGLLFLLLMTLLRVTFLLAFAAPSNSEPVPYGRALFLGLRYDARMVAVACLIFFALGLIPALNPFRSNKGKKLAMGIWFALILVAGIFYAIDFANYAYLNERLNAGLLNYVADARTSAAMMWQTYPVIRISLGIALSLYLLLKAIGRLYQWADRTAGTATKATAIGGGVAFFLLLAFLIFGRIGQYPLRWSDAFILGNDYASNVALNPFQSFFSSLQFRNATFNKEKVKRDYPLIAAYLGVARPDSSRLDYLRRVQPDSPLKRQPNVVIVICESFSAYKSSMYGNPLNTTPYFAGMCREGIFFDRCFTPGYGTARGVWTTITGTPDVALSKTSSRNPQSVNQHTIMNDFKGYEKYYMIGGSLSWANIRGILTNNIQDLHIYEQDDYKAAKVDVWGVSDKNLLLSANKIFATQQKPFIAVVQTADNHRPYTIPDEDKVRFKILTPPADSLKRFGFESVDEYNAFRYTDFCFREFIEAAKKEAYFNNTIFVFVGDHGIGGDAGDMFPRAWSSELTAMHVPLLFYAPALFPHSSYSFPASQCDVLPTVAGLCRIPYRNTTLGRDLLSPFMQQDPSRQLAFIYNPDRRRIGIVKDSVFCSYNIEGKPRPQFFSLKDNTTPVLDQAAQDHYYQLTDAWYQTARYMLLNNKIK
ncbi:LTA synthase family protein [Taibaiella koreensis]|uniref:LTA synthase family protein n=1 Tax=Taibaiella koreensis TaxID=1268548 RepID=UPI0013C30A23|nr:LTA synthase family protein [Taibaiella koreensis]